MVFPIAANTNYTATNPTGEWIFSGSSTGQTITLTNSAHGNSAAIHPAGRIAIEFGATARASGSFNVDDRLTRGNS